MVYMYIAKHGFFILLIRSLELTMIFPPRVASLFVVSDKGRTPGLAPLNGLEWMQIIGYEYHLA
jgi:hypothetical protein